MLPLVTWPWPSLHTPQAQGVHPAGPDYQPLVFVGRTEGQVVPARGAHEFGWDPIFQPDGFEEVRGSGPGSQALAT